jgi:nicotinamidase/pyrazinamidase
MTINKDHDVLIVVDVQNDFCPGGALGVQEGDKIIPAINRLIQEFTHVVFTRDWHPVNHISFSNDPQFVDKSWPVHCVAETDGAQFHPDLSIPADAIIVSKATKEEVEAYSCFQDTDLASRLMEMTIQRIFICGLATDYCVKFTTLDALKAGFDVAEFINSSDL